MRPEEFYKNKMIEDCKKTIHWIEVDNKNQINELMKKAAKDILPSCKLNEDSTNKEDNEKKNSADGEIDIVYSKSRYIQVNGCIDHVFYVNGNLIVFTDSFLYYPEITEDKKAEEVNGIISFKSEYMEEQTRKMKKKVNELQLEKKRMYEALKKLHDDIKHLTPKEIPRLYARFEKLQKLMP